MKWKKLSLSTKTSIYIALTLLILGLIPIFFVHHTSITDIKSTNIDIVNDYTSDIFKKLEIEQSELSQLIEDFKRDTLTLKNSLLLKHTKSTSTDTENPATTSTDTTTTDITTLTNMNIDGKYQVIPIPEPITYNTPKSDSARSILVVGGTGMKK